jgi:hypothetical protein
MLAKYFSLSSADQWQPTEDMRILRSEKSTPLRIIKITVLFNRDILTGRWLIDWMISKERGYFTVRTL